MNTVQRQWTEEEKQKLRELGISPRQNTRIELRAIVRWVKEGLEGKSGRPTIAIYDKSRGVPSEDGMMVIRSQGFVYGKIIDPVGAGNLNWLFDDSPGDVIPPKEHPDAILGIGTIFERVTKDHWDDLRGIVQRMKQRLRIQVPIRNLGWSITMPAPTDAVDRRLWENLRTHTADHKLWSFLKNLRAQGDLVTSLEKTIDAGTRRLSEERKWSEKTRLSVLHRVRIEPEKEVYRPKSTEDDEYDFHGIMVQRANLMREIPAMHKYQLAVVRLREMHGQIEDSLASLELRHQFMNRCADCPDRVM